MTPLLGVLQALAALVLIFALVWYGRRALARGSLFSRRSGHMQIEDRIAVDLRHALVIVRVEERRLLLSLSDHGPAQLLVELSPHAPPDTPVSTIGGAGTGSRDAIEPEAP